MDVNVNGCFYTVQAVARHMLKQPNGGSIITLSSISASIVNRPQYQVVYNTSKAAVGMMTKCLAAEWATRKIRVNAISPGYMMTDMVKKYIDHNKELGEEWVSHTPMKRIGDPKELRGAVVFLASDAASYMTGSEVVVDGGYLVY
jgi:NAD(P)-dependent dehydrogenase (short-subunit alcohol dehydrogenase family)